MTIIDFILRILLKLINKTYDLVQRFKAREFNTYKEALSTCSNFGYEQQELINVVYEKTKIYRDSLLKQSPPHC